MSLPQDSHKYQHRQSHHQNKLPTNTSACGLFGISSETDGGGLTQGARRLQAVSGSAVKEID
eukprot:4971945-Amphidinium_carterae.2